MVRSTLNILSLFIALVALCFRGLAQAQSQDPTEFFDATDNDAYLQWLQDATRDYERTLFLPSPAGPFDGAAIHWTIEGDSIYLAVAARATGWVGFGVAENGGMSGADVVLFTADTNTLQDSYILDDRFPIADDCQSWTLLNSQTDGGFVIFEGVRLLDTGDTQDRPIVDDSTVDVAAHRIIAAWGDTLVPGNHGPDSRVRSALRFHGDGNVEDLTAVEAEAEGVLLLGAVDYPVKPIETEYANFCFSTADLNDMGMPNNTELHSIAFEPIIDPRGEKYVHHFVLYATFEATREVVCNETDWFETAYAWAPGEGPFVLPSNVGGPLGENGFKSFRLEIHYNNPSLDTGVVDSSGIRVYYTSQKREFDMGIMMTGDPLVSLIGQPVGDGMVQHSFDCPASCTSTVLQQSVTVIREGLHMHKTGRSMYNYQSRDGAVIRVGAVDYFDFDQQGLYSVPQAPFQIEAGDSFRTECFYESNNGETFGLSSQEEMCMAFLFYFPRQQIEIPDAPPGSELPIICGYQFGTGFCDTEWEKLELASTADFHRTFGSSPEGTCPTGTTTGSSTSAAASFGWSFFAMVFIQFAFLGGFIL